MKIVYKILLMIILPISVISVITIIFINSLLYSELEKRFVEILEHTTITYASLVDARLDRISEYAEIFANQYEINPKDINEDHILKTIKSILDLDTIIFGSSVYLDTTYQGELSKTIFYSYRKRSGYESIVVNSENPEYNIIFETTPNYISEPRRVGKGVWTSPYFDEGLSNTYMVTYSQPIFKNDIIIGYVTIDLSLNDLEKMLIRKEKIIEGKYNTRLLILNIADSNVVYSEKHDMIGRHMYEYYNKEYAANNKGSLNIDSIIAQEIGTGRAINRFGENKLYASFAPITNSNWKAVNVMDISDVDDYINKTVYQTLVAITIVLVALILIVYYTSRIITKPVGKLSDATINIAQGDYKNIISIKSKDEIGTLANNFNIMAREIDKRETELEEANKSLERAQNQLLTLEDAKNSFLQLISHEIRTPLNGIVGSTHFLKDMINDPELADFVEMLKESVDRLDNFSGLALEITEMRAKGQDVGKEKFKLDPIIHEVLEIYKEDIELKSLTVDLTLGENIEIETQQNYFRKSFIELISNTVKYASEDTTIWIKTLDENGKVMVSVSDQGEVIPQEKIEEIVKPFGLAKEHIDKNIGLGLAYIKQYLDLNDAKIEISSTEEKTEFVFIFNGVN